MIWLNNGQGRRRRRRGEREWRKEKQAKEQKRKCSRKNWRFKKLSRSRREADRLLLWGAEFSLYSVLCRPFSFLLSFLFRYNRGIKGILENNCLFELKRNIIKAAILYRPFPGDNFIDYQGPGIYHTVTTVSYRCPGSEVPARLARG